MESTADLVTQSVADLRKKPKTFREMSLREKGRYVIEVVTVEPLLGVYVFVSFLCQAGLFNLEVEKGCRVNSNFSDEICDGLLYTSSDNFTEEYKQIQNVIGEMHSWQQPVQSLVPLILVLFLGSYSDRHKIRKPFLLLPVVGELFSIIGVILCVIFMKQWPLEVQGVLQTIVPSFFGGQTMIAMAAFAYIADVSTLEMRTLRVGIVQIVLNICTPVAQALSGILFEKIGYIGILCIAAALYVLALCYGLFWIKEPKTPVPAKKGFVADAFDPKHVVDTFSLLLKKSAGNNRLYIVLVLLLVFVYNVVNTGEASVFYFYAVGAFDWGPAEYGYFSTINTVVHFIGTVVGVPLFTDFFKLQDITILAITFIDKALANIVFALARTAAVLYAGVVVSILTGLTSVAIRSLATKVVSENDLGKAQSLCGICEAIGQAVAAPLYNAGVYLNTLDSFPAAYFLLGIILYAACTILIIWMYFQISRRIQVQTNGVSKEIDVTDEVQMTHM